MPKRQSSRRTLPVSPPAAKWRALGSIAAPILILAAGIAVYANSFSGVFVFDDLGSTVENPHIRHLWPIWDAMTNTPAGSTVSGRPLVNLSLAINYAISGLDVWSYHAVNLAIHLACALLLFATVRRTLSMPGLAERFGNAAVGLATAVAILWVVHPLQTDAVTYIIQRTELMMALFYLLTLYCASRGFTADRRWPWFSAAVLFCAAGMGCKEVMVSAPVAVLVYDRTFVSRSWRTSLWTRTGLYVGLLLTWVPLAAVVALGGRSETVGFGLGTTGVEYLKTQAGVILWYLRLCFWPVGLAISYDDWPLARDFASVWPQLAVVALLVVGTVVALWRRSGAGFLGAAFFMILAPTSSFVPIVSEIAAERRMYLPLAAVITLVVVTGYRVLTRLARRSSPRVSLRLPLLGAGLVGTATVFLSLGTVSRNRVYGSAMLLWTDHLARHPHDARAHQWLANELATQGDLDTAIVHLRESVRLEPSRAPAYNDLANLLARKGQFTKAIEFWNLALAMKPDAPIPRTNLATTLAVQGRVHEAIEHYQKALDCKPDIFEAQANLGVLLQNLGRTQEAIPHLEHALRLKPDETPIRKRLNAALASRPF